MPRNNGFMGKSACHKVPHEQYVHIENNKHGLGNIIKFAQEDKNKVDTSPITRDTTVRPVCVSLTHTPTKTTLTHTGQSQCKSATPHQKTNTGNCVKVTDVGEERKEERSLAWLVTSYLNCTLRRPLMITPLTESSARLGPPSSLPPTTLLFVQSAAKCFIQAANTYSDTY